MKTNSKIFWSLLVLFSATFLFSCSDDDAPLPENEEEEITSVVLTFTPTTTTEPALDFIFSEPAGSTAPTVEPILLDPNTEYILTVSLLGPNGENISAEVAAEAEDHMFFYGWTEGLFSAPTGNGNIDNRADPVNYLDTDSNGQPLGLSTRWITASATTTTNNEFTIILKHQPGTKSATSDVNTGATDLEIIWPISIQ